MGDIKAPLLRVVDAAGNFADTIHRLYTTPQYVPVSKKEFNTVEIDIRDDTGRPVLFVFGKVITTLHFRRSGNNEASRALYEDYYTKQSGGELPVFYGSRTQRGHGIGSVLGGGACLDEPSPSSRMVLKSWESRL